MFLFDLPEEKDSLVCLTKPHTTLISFWHHNPLGVDLHNHMLYIAFSPLLSLYSEFNKHNVHMESAVPPLALPLAG